MIITGLKAENILRYSKLELNGLPRQGVIAISGQNESGKSSIGETVCFALFGRTFSLGEEELEKIIHWSKSGCSVALNFDVGDGSEYCVERFLDGDGMHSARLSRVGEEEPMARGVERVADALYELLGYEYDEFVDSFYLAQREITTPHPHSHTVRTMAGIANLQYVAAEIEDEVEQEQRRISEADARIVDVDQEIDDLAINNTYLPQLQHEREQVTADEQANSQRLERLEEASVGYQQAHPSIERARGSRSTNGALRSLMLIGALIAGGTWLLLTQMPEQAISKSVLDVLQREIPDWGPKYTQWLSYAAGGLGGLFLLLQIRVSMLGGRIAELMPAARELAEALSDALQDTAQVEPGPVDEAAEEADEEEFESDEQRVERPDDRVLAACERIAAASCPAAEALEWVGQVSAWVRDQNRLLQVRQSELDHEIYREQERLRLADNLQKERTALSSGRDEAERRIEQRELAGELLAGATRHMSRQFNHDVRDLVSRTLPLFTEDRYQHLQIGEDLGVRVFSGEKGDFLDLEEISSGTQRQIMLALRLALSQELVNRAVRGKQFLFLDEPFAFFDQKRTETALAALPQLSDDISQIFIVAQAFPDSSKANFALHLHCSRDDSSMSVGNA